MNRKKKYYLLQYYIVHSTYCTAAEVDLLAAEDFIDLWSGTKVQQKSLECSFSEHIKLNGVKLKKKTQQKITETECVQVCFHKSSLGCSFSLNSYERFT